MNGTVSLVANSMLSLVMSGMPGPAVGLACTVTLPGAHRLVFEPRMCIVTAATLTPGAMARCRAALCETSQGYSMRSCLGLGLGVGLGLGSG